MMVGSPWLLGLVLLEQLAAGPPSLLQAAFVNRCRSPSTRVCDFVCDCWDCSDENWCGYQKESVTLGTPFACDFEGSMCGWEDVSATAYRWGPAQASISTWGKEPSFDHTLGTDLGWFLTTSKQRVKPSAVAQLRSPFLREAAATCEIRAWYHLWGPGLSETQPPTLTLELSQGSSIVTLWRNPPRSVYSWRELVAYTGRIHGAFQVTFSSNATETVQLALDDVEFRNCAPPRPQTCGPDEFLCQQGGCIPWDRLCDRTEDCRDGEDETETTCKSFSVCEFEQDWCDWEVEPNKTLSWARNSSLQVAPSHAWPTRDHSTNSPAGSFAYVTSVPSRGLQLGDAWLTSPMLKVNGSCQLVLYVHLYASNSNRLNIYYRTGTTMKLVRTRAGDLGDYWVREKVDFQVEQVDFQIVIEGLIGTGHQGNIALDDLVLSPGCLKQGRGLLVSHAPDPHMPCSQDQFACNNSKQCINVELVCDFKTDCADLSDEWNCGVTSFTSGTGGWTDISVGRLQWVLRNASSQPDSTGPVFSLQNGPGQMLSLAKAATPALGPSGSACTLEMSFTTGPQGILALAVADESLGTRRWVWYELGNGTATWTWVRVPLGARARPFQLELLAMADLKGPGGDPLLAVSNVTLVGCRANASLAQASGLTCNFERDWCEWFMEQNDGFEWERRASGGWGMDHTTGTGSFLSVDPSAPGAQGLSARLISPSQVAAAAKDSCLSFWYRMDGPQIGTLNLLVKYGEKPEQVLWTRTGSQGAVWHLASSTISQQPGQNYQVVFEALRDGFLGVMALDDISERPGICGTKKHCTFETDDCGLLVSKPQAWVRQDGAGCQGPPTDHTQSTPEGHYMFINTSTSALHSGQTAVLRSQGFPPLLGTHCVTFWYYLSSSNPGSLSVSVEEGGRQKEKSHVRRVQAEGWRHGNVTVKVQAEWQVAFVVEGAGGGPSSFLALDDFHVEEGVCLEAGSCNFESGTCGWNKPHGDWYSWDWKAGATPSLSPSPKEDHSLGTKAGHYAYVDVAVLGLGRRTAARLASEPLPSTTSSCLRFHYHMDFLGQSSQAELRVKLSGPQGERTVWSAAGHQSWAWLNQTLLVSSPTEFQIVLEATSGAWPSSETIAVDDISYTVGPGCDENNQKNQGGESSPGKSSVAGLVAGVVCSTLLVLVAAAVAIYFLRKPRAAGDRMPEESNSVTGFDNITFRDDTVILPWMPINGETE